MFLYFWPKKKKVKEQEFLEFNGNSSANLHDVLSKQSQQQW